jgi:TonB family protein
LNGETVYARAPLESAESAPAATVIPADSNRKKLLLVVGLMMTLVVVVGAVLYFSFRKPAPDIVPPGGTFNVVIADKAVEETPAAGQSEPVREIVSETGIEAVTPPAAKVEEPPKTIEDEAKKPETLVEKKTEMNVKETLPDLIGQLEKQEPPVAAKEEPAKIPPAAAKSATRLPRLLRQVDPVYPEDALRDRIDGDVTLNLTVGFNGRVERAVVVKSIPKLDAAAMAAARKWEFAPGLLEGIPIQATLQVTIHFTFPPESARPKSGGEAVKSEPPVQPKPKPADPPPSIPPDDVSRAAGLLERGFRIEALAMARRILSVQPNLAEAKSIALDAVIQLASGEIKSLVDQYAASYKAGQTAEFFRLHARPDVYNRLRGDLEMMTSAAREVQITVSNLNLDFQMARYPEFQTRAVFSQVMTGIPSSKLYREVMFEGRYSWILERRENDWVIVAVKVE